MGNQRGTPVEIGERGWIQREVGRIALSVPQRTHRLRFQVNAPFGEGGTKRLWGGLGDLAQAWVGAKPLGHLLCAGNPAQLPRRLRPQPG